MVGGVGEYLSLLTGYSVLLGLIALCYAGALLARRGLSRAADARHAEGRELPEMKGVAERR
jgi:hypothetical protein